MSQCHTVSVAASGKVRMLSGSVSACGVCWRFLCYSIKVTFVRRGNSHFTVGEYPTLRNRVGSVGMKNWEKVGMEE